MLKPIPGVCLPAVSLGPGPGPGVYAWGPGSPWTEGSHGGALSGQEANKERKVSPIPPLKREIYN